MVAVFQVIVTLQSAAKVSPPTGDVMSGVGGSIVNGAFEISTMQFVTASNTRIKQLALAARAGMFQLYEPLIVE